MKTPVLPANHPKLPFGQRVGVLIVNLGTPEAPTAAALRPYLREFLSDRRVVELPRWFWIPLLYGIIVPTRAPKSAHAYEQIWDWENKASPLRVITEAQERELQARLGETVVVKHAMRYGRPSIASVLDEMMAAGCGRIAVLPLYPQYAGATVGTVGDEVARWLLTQRWQPAVRMVAPYYSEPAYIQALADSVRTFGLTDYRVNGLTGKAAPSKAKADVIVASFHGMPLKACQDGDVYYCHCHKTARLLAEELGVPFCKTIAEVKKAKGGKLPPVLLTFQSRFGKAEWLQPYTAEVLEALPKAGIKDIQVIMPGFAADCVETLEEIAIQGRESFVGAGGESYGVIPCLNDSKDGMDMLEGLVLENLAGWV